MMFVFGTIKKDNPHFTDLEKEVLELTEELNATLEELIES